MSPDSIFPTDVMAGSSVIAVAQAGPDRSLPDKPVKAADPVKRTGMGGGLAGFGQFPGFRAAPPYQNPWVRNPYLAWMLRFDPTLNHVFEAVCGPVRTAARSIQVDDLGAGPATCDDVKAIAERVLLPLVDRAMPGALEATAFGCWPQEMVYYDVDGRTDPVGVLPILPGEGTLYRDEFGAFMGVEIAGQWRDARYVFLATHNGHLQPVLGRGNNEAAYAAWHRAEQSALNADRVERKVSGMQFALFVAAGAVPINSATGEPEDPVAFGRKILAGMKDGQSPVFEKWAFEKDQIANNPALADVPAISYDLLNFGDLGPSLQAHLKRLDRCDVEKWRCWGVSERALAEASQHGGFADAKVHSDAIGPLSDFLHSQYLGQFNEQTAAYWQRANWGKAKLRIRVVPTQAADEDLVGAARALVTTLATNTNTNPAIAAHLDERALLKLAGMPLVTEDVASQRKADAEAKAKADAAAKQAVDLAKAKGLAAAEQGRGDGPDRTAAADVQPDPKEPK